MIKPSEFRSGVNHEPNFSSFLQVITDACDDALRRGRLHVSGGRGGWALADIETVAAMYRAEGWDCVVDRNGDLVFQAPSAYQLSSWGHGGQLTKR